MALALSSLLAIFAQASLFAGSFAVGLTTEAIGVVLNYMDFGKAALARTIVALAAAAWIIVLPPFYKDLAWGNGAGGAGMDGPWRRDRRSRARNSPGKR